MEIPSSSIISSILKFCTTPSIIIVTLPGSKNNGSNVESPDWEIFHTAKNKERFSVIGSYVSICNLPVSS